VEVVFGRYRQIDDWPTIGRAAEDFARRSPPTPPARHASTNGKPDPTNGTSAPLGTVDFSHAVVYEGGSL
jgi:hypothetical protein